MARSLNAPVPPADPPPVFDHRWPDVLPDLVSLPSERLEAEICTGAAHLDAALCRWLVLVGEFDRRAGWASWECRTCAQWLSWKCGISRTTAHEQVRVGRALLVRPLIREAFGRGEISYSKVRAITRIDEPALEAELLDLARASTGAGLERIVRAYRRYGSIASADQVARAHDQRQVTWYFDDDGGMVIRGRLPADTGAVVIQALNAAHDERVRDESSSPDADATAGDAIDGDHDPANGGRSRDTTAAVHPLVAEAGADERDVNAADDLVHLARRYLGHTDADGRRAGHELIVLVDAELLTDSVLAAVPDVSADSAVSTGPEAHVADHTPTDVGGPGGDQAAARAVPAAGGEPAAGAGRVISAPTDTLARGAAATRRARGLGQTCELALGPALHPETARRLACDVTAVAAILDRDANPLHLGRRHRVVNRRLRRALMIRDRTCHFPGCTRRGHLEAHHLVHWINGGPTDPDNVVLLCEHHHTRVHEGHWILVGRPGQSLDARHPDGRVMHAVPRAGVRTTGATIAADNRRVGLDIHRRTNEPEWEGRSADLAVVIDVLDGILTRQPRPDHLPTDHLRSDPHQQDEEVAQRAHPPAA